MRILGIIAEYDPFHNGHLHHLSRAKEQVSPDLTYTVLSPCIKQRGSFSLLSPSDRAACALAAGADAVFALPVLWTVRDAEHYALGAVSLLASLGATHLAFGAETADLQLLRKAAEVLESSSDVFRSFLKESLSGGAGYPSALSNALSAVLPCAAGLLERPNNTLAVCYLRAILRLRLPVTPVVIPRLGSYHAYGINPSYPSASALRAALLRGDYSASFNAVPSYTAAVLRRRFLEGRIPDEDIAGSLLLSRLRSMSAEDFRQLPDLSEGMENNLREAAVTACSRLDLLSALTCRRYPAARISRLCASALLGITGRQLKTLPLPDSALLLALRTNTKMTVLWRSLPLRVYSSFTEWKKAASPADLAAWRLWAQCCRLPATLPYIERIITESDL